MLEVKFFAKACQLVGSSQVRIEWSDGQTVLRLKETLVQMYPRLLPLIPSLLVAVNNAYANDNTIVHNSDEVACFPPVSGG